MNPLVIIGDKIILTPIDSNDASNGQQKPSEGKSKGVEHGCSTEYLSQGQGAADRQECGLVGAREELLQAD